MRPQGVGKRPGRFRRAPVQETGAVLVEASIVSLLVLIFLAGIVDYASLYGNAIDVSAAVRTAARTGTSTDGAVVTDDQIIADIVEKAGEKREGIERIVIYKAAPDSKGPPLSCQTGTTSSIDKCNVYTPPLFNLNAVALQAQPESQGWPAATRQPGTDHLGVWVKVHRAQLMVLVWSPQEFSDYAVMRMDPINTGATPAPTGFTVGPSLNPGDEGEWCYGTACTTGGGNVDAGGPGGSS